MPLLRNITGLQGANPLEMAKFLAANVGGRISAWIVATMGTVYLFQHLVAKVIGFFLGAAAAAEAIDFCGRLQWCAISYLLAIYLYRQIRNTKLLTSTLAALTIADPNQSDRSSDPEIQRAIVQQKAATASQTGASYR